MSKTLSKKKQLPLKAVTFAAKSHDGQMRKDNVTPYIAHPFRVMTILSDVFGVDDEEVLAAGVLHDTIEDTDVEKEEIRDRFGKNIAYYVDILTKDTSLDKPIREELYAQELAQAPVKVRLCKLADIYDNISHTKALSPEKKAKTIERGERLFLLMTADFPSRWDNVVQIVGEKIRQLKQSLTAREDVS